MIARKTWRERIVANGVARTDLPERFCQKRFTNVKTYFSSPIVNTKVGVNNCIWADHFAIGAVAR